MVDCVYTLGIIGGVHLKVWGFSLGLENSAMLNQLGLICTNNFNQNNEEPTWWIQNSQESLPVNHTR